MEALIYQHCKTWPLNSQDQICTMFPSKSNDDAVIIPRPKQCSSIFDDFVRVQRHSFDIVIFSNVVKDVVKVAWYVFIRLLGSCIDPTHYYKASSVQWWQIATRTDCEVVGWPWTVLGLFLWSHCTPWCSLSLSVYSFSQRRYSWILLPQAFGLQILQCVFRLHFLFMLTIIPIVNLSTACKTTNLVSPYASIQPAGGSCFCSSHAYINSSWCNRAALNTRVMWIPLNRVPP